MVEGQAYPAGHTVHTLWEPTLKVPAAHRTAVLLEVEGQWYPAAHGVHAICVPRL